MFSSRSFLGMQCPKCNAECDNEAAFCHKCGASLQAPADAPDEASQAPPRAASPHDQFLQSTAPGQVHGSDDDDPEDEIWKGSFSKKGMIGQWIMATAVTIVGIILTAILPHGGWNGWLIVLGLILAMWGVLVAWYGYKRLSVHYTLTTQRLIHEAGLLWRTIDRIELIDIDDVTFKQGPVERAFRVGRIIVISGDKTSPELILPGIDNVRQVADEIDDARRKERRRRGLHMITQGAS
ncbi:MAG: PH domain-containing protein [Planctomycetales bacterium]|nr:PH domain-containing protein [Planctomycetales bacterium]